jgi:hypothetical protein
MYESERASLTTRLFIYGIQGVGRPISAGYTIDQSKMFIQNFAGAKLVFLIVLFITV